MARSLWQKFKDQLDPTDGGKTWKDERQWKPTTADRVRDIFDANTQADINKRVNAGQAPSYSQQQRDMGKRGITNPVKSVAYQVADPVARAANTFAVTGAKGARSIYDLLDIAKTSVTGTDKEYQDKVVAANRRLETGGYSKKGGLLGAGTSLNNVNDLNDPKKFVGSMVETGANLASVVPTGAAAKAGVTQTGKQFIKSTAQNSAINAGVNVAADGGEQYRTNGKIDPKQTLIAAVTGAALPVAGAVGGKTVRAVSKSKPLDQKGGYDGTPIRQEGTEPKVEVPQTPKGTTSSIADAMPDLAARRQNPITDAQAIANDFGGKTDDIQRNIDMYGLDRTRQMYQAKSQSPSVQNVDAVVSSELKKQGKPVKVVPSSKMSPEEEASLFATEPTVRVTQQEAPKVNVVKDKPIAVQQPEAPRMVKVANGDVVDTVTGEVQKPDLVTQVKQLPRSEEATVEALPQVTSTMDEIKNGFDMIGKGFDKETLMQWRKEVAAQNRDGTPLSEKSRQIQDAINPLLDELHAVSKRDMGKIEGDYLPEARTRGDVELTPFGTSFIDKVNSEFGFSKTRKNAIPIDELGDPIEALKNYTEQLFNDNYGHLRAAENPYLVSQVDDPVNYVKGSDEIAKKLARKVDTELNNKTGKTVKKSELIVDDLHRNYVENGGKFTFVVDAKPPLGKAARTRRNILKDLNVYEEWGFGRHERATGTATQLYEDAYQDILDLTPEQLNQRMQQDFGGQLEDAMGESEMIRTVAEKVARSDDEAYHRMLFVNLEKALAATNVKSAAERAEILDANTKSIINSHVEYVLGDGRRRYGMGDRIANGIIDIFHLGALGLNPYSAAQNLTETSRTVGLVGPKVAAQATKELADGTVTVDSMLKRFGQDGHYLDQANNLPTNRGRTAIDKTKDGLMFMFQKTEEYKDAHMLRSLEIESENMGLTGREQATYIMDKYNDHALKYGNYGSVQGTQSPVGRAIWQFTQYPVKDLGITLKYAKDLLGGDREAQTKALSYLLKTGGAKAVYTVPMYLLFGASFQTLLGGNIPKGGPVVSIPLQFIDAMRDENNKAEEEKREFDWGKVWDNAGQKAAAITVPGGNYLINKLGVQNLIAEDTPFKDDTAINTWEKGYIENKNGRARIEGPDNVFDFVRQALGGAYNTTASEGYFGKTPFTFDLPGERFDINKKEMLRPLSEREQKYFDSLPDKKAKNDFIKANHAQTIARQEIDKKLGDRKTLLDQAIYGTEGQNKEARQIEQANILLNNPDILEAYNTISKADPMPYKDPLFKLSPDEQKKYFTYLAAENDKYGQKQIEKDNSWITDFKKERGQFFGEVKKYSTNTTPKTGLTKPNLDEGSQQRVSAYFELSDPTQRKDYLAANPELQTYFKQLSDYDRASRAERGLPQYDPYPEADANTQKLLDEYTSQGPASSPDRKAYERSAWIKANPKKWAVLSDYFSKTSLWTLQNDMAQAVYENSDPTEKGVKAIASLGKTLNGSGYGGGSNKTSSKIPTIDTQAAPETSVRVKVAKVKVKKRTPKKIAIKRGKMA